MNRRSLTIISPFGSFSGAFEFYPTTFSLFLPPLSFNVQHEDERRLFLFTQGFLCTCTLAACCM